MPPKSNLLGKKNMAFAVSMKNTGGIESHPDKHRPQDTSSAKNSARGLLILDKTLMMNILGARDTLSFVISSVMHSTARATMLKSMI